MPTPDFTIRYQHPAPPPLGESVVVATGWMTDTAPRPQPPPRVRSRRDLTFLARVKAVEHAGRIVYVAGMDHQGGGYFHEPREGNTDFEEALGRAQRLAYDFGVATRRYLGRADDPR